MKIARTFFLIVVWANTSIIPLLAQWVQTNEPYRGKILCLAVSDTNLFAGTDGEGVFRSTDNGNSWTAASTGLTNTPVQALAVLDTKLFAGTHDGIFLSTNNGSSWILTGTALTGLMYTSVRAFAVSPNRTDSADILAGTGGGGVFLSTNNGISWAPAGLTHVNVRSLAVSFNGTGDTILFAGTNGSGAFRSIDNGKSWISASSGLTYAGVLSLAVSPNGIGGTNLIAGTWGGIFISTNNGTSWTEASTGLTFTYVYCLAISYNETGGTNLFAGTWNGVFLSVDNGINWTAVNTGLTNTDVFSLVVSGNNLFAGTDGGVWRCPLSEITSVGRLSIGLPKHFNLRQNYPNPFNPSTTISFELPSKSFVSLKIFDGLGREVAALISEELYAGNYAHKWNAESLPSGIYFYRMFAKQISGDRNYSYIETKKLILMK